MPTTLAKATGDWRAKLDDDQLRAAAHSEGPLIVLAGPGTGKTRTLMGRIRRLLDESGAEPESIAALTFSVKAAQEMRERLAAQIAPGVADRITLSTFHSFGASLVARFGDMIGVPTGLRLMDSAQQRRLLRSIIRTGEFFKGDGAAGDAGAVDEARRFIAQCRDAGRFPSDALEYGRAWVERGEANETGLAGDDLEAERYRANRFFEHAQVFDRYEPRALELGLVTFDDYLALPIRILREAPVAAAMVRSDIGHVLVDEFQDVNSAQIELLRLLAPPAPGRDLCVVGDDDQAIYAFRGADTRAFDRFASVWTEHTTIELRRNYRSRAEVIALTNQIIARAADRFAPGKSAVPGGEGDRSGGTIEGVIVDDDKHLGLAIAGMILADHEAHREREWTSYGVLARANPDVDRISSELRLHGIPVATRAALDPLSDQGVLDLMAWLELVAGRNQRMALQRLLLRPPVSQPVDGVDRWRQDWEWSAAKPEDRGELIEHIRAHCDGEDEALKAFFDLYDELRRVARTSPSEQLIEEVIRRVDVVHGEVLDGRMRARRVRHVVALLRFGRSVQGALEPPGDIEAFWAHYDDLEDREKRLELPSHSALDRHGDDDSGELEGAGVRVLTAHGAKGLEFDTVFAARVRPGHGFPMSKKGQDDEELPEAFTGRPTPQHADEERRLFYVACTRAERRLVLLAKRKKNRSKTIDYYDEIKYDEPELGLVEHEGQDWLERSGLSLPASIELSELEEGRKALRQRELAAARHEAYLALHGAQRAEVGAGDLAALEARLAGAARRIASIAALESTGALPEWAKGDEALENLEQRHTSGERPERLLRPMAGPLEVSYSRITDYERCPRCFYMRHVLGVSEAPNRALGLGNLVHQALERFFKSLQRAEGEGEPAPGRAQLVEILDGLAQREARRSGPVDPTMIEQALAQAILALESLHEEGDNLLELEKLLKFRYRCPLGRYEQGHVFQARIDRLDQPATGGIRIVDYKTGKPSKSKLEPDKKDFQLAIYALAVAQHMGEGDLDAAPIRGVAEYWVLATGQRGTIEIQDLDLDKARQRIDEAITGMLEGAFERGAKCWNLCAMLPEA